MEADVVLAERLPDSVVLAMKLLRSVVTLAWCCLASGGAQWELLVSEALAVELLEAVAVLTVELLMPLVLVVD